MWDAPSEDGFARTVHLANFASSTGASVIAEGIEDEAMARQMAAPGVDLGQGFGLGRPRRLEISTSADASPARRGQTAGA